MNTKPQSSNVRRLHNRTPEATPPHSIEAEQSTLGGLMLDNDAWDKVADILTEADFYRADHRLIFEAMRELADKGSPFDVVTLKEALEAKGRLEDAGGFAYLGVLGRDTPAAANVEFYAGIVRDKSRARTHKRREELNQEIEARQREMEALNAILVPGSAKPTFFELDEFLNAPFPPRENLLAPWVYRGGLTMVHAWRGTGKTHFALGVVFAVATGGRFLKWDAPAPRGVLLVDGESDPAEMQERLRKIREATAMSNAAPIRVLTHAVFENGINLSTPEGRQLVEDALTDDIELIVLDNLATLTARDENEGREWIPLQQWLLNLRARGKTVLMVQHEGKNGQQRGHSRVEDVLNIVISLKRPSDYSPEQGARFEVHFEKARGLYGKDVEPFEAQLTVDEHGRQVWTIKGRTEGFGLGDRQQEVLALLAEEPLSTIELARALHDDDDIDCNSNEYNATKQLVFKLRKAELIAKHRFDKRWHIPEREEEKGSTSDNPSNPNNSDNHDNPDNPDQKGIARVIGTPQVTLSDNPNKPSNDAASRQKVTRVTRVTGISGSDDFPGDEPPPFDHPPIEADEKDQSITRDYLERTLPKGEKGSDKAICKFCVNNKGSYCDKGFAIWDERKQHRCAEYVEIDLKAEGNL